MNKVLKIIKEINDWGYVYVFTRYLKRILLRDVRIKHEAVLRYLERNYQDVIEKYKAIPLQKGIVLSSDCPIWVFWAQGEESMPPIVSACLNSIKRNADMHPVRFLTMKNYRNYVDIPEYIVDKLYNKEISYTHFSDILRNALLFQCGGIWLDATIYMTGKLNGWNKAFYTLKQNSYDDHTYVSDYKWTGFCMGGVAGNILNGFVYDMLLQYHRKENKLIDFFLIDYIIAVGYRNIPQIKELIDTVSYNNSNLYFLVNHWEESFDADAFNNITKDTNIFKTSYKINPPIDNVESYYKMVIEQRL